MYLTYEDREPMIEFDVVSGQIRAYPAKDYLEDLTDRTRDIAKKQYQKAIAEGSLMVFVRDEAKRVLRSYVFPSASGQRVRGARERRQNKSIKTTGN